MKKVLGGILLVVYSIIAITVTVLLLSYNEYNCSEIGGYTVFIVNDDSLEPDYKQGSILLIRETSDKNVQIGDEMFLYKVINSQEYELVNRTLADKIQQGNHITYVVTNEENGGDEENYANDYFIGKASDTKVIEGWGYVLGLLESKWGYLFCVVIVSLLLFLQEVFELAMEIKYGKADREAEEEAERAKRAGRTKRTQGTRTTEITKATKATTSSTAKSPKAGTTRTTSSVSKKSTTGTTKEASSAKKTSTTKPASSTKKASATKATAVEEKNETNSEEE